MWRITALLGNPSYFERRMDVCQKVQSLFYVVNT